MADLGNRYVREHLRERAERELGALVIAVEFTLISVMVGVILFPLMDMGTALLRDLQFQYWLYILGGLMFVLLLWTQVISHSLSFIGWPLDVGHNLLYIVFALALGIQMHFLSDPRGWFAVSVVSTGVAWLLVYYDAHLIEERRAGARAAAAELYETALARQRRVIVAMRLAMLDSVVNLGLIVGLPQLFIERPGHIILIAVQTLFIYLFTARTIKVFRAWSDPIVRKTMDELATEGEQ